MWPRSEALDRLALDRGVAITTWSASWPRQPRLGRLLEAVLALEYHYRRAILTGGSYR